MKLKLISIVCVITLALMSLPAWCEDFFFVQISDPQLGFSVGNDDIAPDIAALDSAILHINRLHPAFLLVTGDMVNSSKNDNQWLRYLELISKVDSEIPVYHIPGNHDVGKLDDEHSYRLDAYLQRMGSDRFSFSYEGCLFVGMNTSIIKDGSSKLIEEQDAWLKDVLSQESDMKFVFGHCPVFRKTFDEKEDYSNFSILDREKYWAIFRLYGVSAVGAGHTHYQRQASYDGIPMNTTGPVTRPLGKGISGIAIWVVHPEGNCFEYNYYPLSDIPNSITLL